MTNVLLSVKGLKKYYKVGRKRVNGKVVHLDLKAVDDLSFDIYRGETLGIVGESGSGKSTLGRCVLKLIDSTAGSVSFEEKDLEKISSADLKKLRRHMQMVFQNPASSFNAKMTIGKALRNVARFYGMSAKQAEEKILELLGYVNLDPSVLSHRSDELSGGQLQRLAIVRALLPEPSFILADEAVSALDVSVQAQILNVLEDMKSRFGLTMMFISHELTIVEHICDRVMVLYLGSMVEIGSTDELFNHTLHPYTQALIASKPRRTPDEQKNNIPLEGEIPSAIDIPAGCRFFSRCPKSINGICNVKMPILCEVSKGHWVACHLVGNEAKSSNLDQKEEEGVND
ncbi:MAG: ABC transporter ATP-binding protein [Lachnospiraceae bacterium]